MSYHDAPQHAGDRVIYDGREYRATSFTGHPYYMAELVATDGTGDFVRVNQANLRMSWCPTQHGGAGRRDDLKVGDIVSTEDVRDAVVCAVEDLWITLMWGDNNRRKVSRFDVKQIGVTVR